MRKILISILIVLLLVLAYFIIFEGIEGFNILSIPQIKDKNLNIDDKLKQVSTLTSVTKPKAMSDLNDNAKQLSIAKEEYNDKVLYSSSEEIASASETRPYETEFIWTRLGNHAKKNAINLRYELRQSSTATSGNSESGSYYDVYFTLTGAYANISEFVASLENDSSLNFKIEAFKIIPSSGDTENLQATFNVKDVLIIVSSVSNTTSSTENTERTNQEGES